jgi:hypothetical protein
MSIVTFAYLAFLLVPSQGEAPKTPSPKEAQASPSEIDQWVFDLGAPDPRRRDEAEQRLSQAGPAALSALRVAARSGNAERALRARELLLKIAGSSGGESQNGHGGAPVPRTTVFYDDWVRGVHFSLAPTGAVELTVPEKNDAVGHREYKTYRADSIEDFKKKYPKVAEEYDLQKFLEIPDVTARERAWSEEMREWMGLREGDRWTEFPFFHHGRMGADGEGRQGMHPGAEGAGRKRLGILVGPVGAALEAQLGLQDGRGFVVRRVEPGSLAERSGIKEYDILLLLNGQPLGEKDFEAFQKEVEKALAMPEFTIELLRGGKPQSLTIKTEGGKAAPPAPKEEK